MTGTAHEEFARLNAEILRAEKRAMLLSLAGRWTASEEANLTALYERRRVWLDARGTERLARRLDDR